MSVHSRLNRLLHLLYAAPGSASNWQGFLLALNDEVHGSGINLITHDFANGRPTVPLTAKTTPDALTEYARRWGGFDPWAHSPRARHLAPGAIVMGEALVPDAEFAETAFYRDFGRHHDVFRCVAATVEASAAGVSVVSVTRGRRQRPFDRRDQDLLAALMPHLQRAIGLHRRLADAESLSDNMSAALERLSHAVLLVSSTARICYANLLARELLASRDALVSDGGELRAHDPADCRRLRAAIAGAALALEGDCSQRRSFLRLGRAGDRPALSVVVCPLASDSPLAAPGSRLVAVFATAAERVGTLSEEDLRAEYSLTPAEARLTLLLTGGRDLASAARELGVSHATAKTNLKYVFEKVGCRRQAELLRVLLSTPPVRRGRPT